MSNILILGGGFGGLMAAERLAKTIGADHRITLVAKSEKFTFYPALVRLAFGECVEDEITFDLREKLDELDVRFVEGEAVSINHERRTARIAGADFDGELHFDILVIALGRRLATEKIGGFFENADHLLGVKAARRFGAKVESFERGKIVCGLAPDAFLPVPVCETAFALARKFKETIENKTISVSVVFPETIEKSFGGADLKDKLEKAFTAHNIEIIENFPTREVAENALISAENKTLNFDLLMLLPPFRGQAFLRDARYTNNADFIETDEFLRVRNLEKTYAVGDIADFPGPKLAFMAIRQAQIAAENIAAELRGATPTKSYQHDIAVIIDESDEKGIFLHYGIWNDILYGIREGKMWSRMKNESDPLWQTMRSI